MTNMLCKVLVVDDVDDVRRTLAGILIDSGYFVKAAGSESEATSILIQEPFQFIVVDIRLHGDEEDDDSGLALVRAIRGNGIHSKIILVTGKSVKGSHFESVSEYGVIGYVEKKKDDWIGQIQYLIEKNFKKFDVFLCHNSEDKRKIKQIGNELIRHGLRPWLDEWELQPGRRWQDVLEQQIEEINSVAIFVGKSGLGPWQEMELKAFLEEFVRRGCSVIPILLNNAPKKPVLPIFLRQMVWVDFRKKDPDPMRQLIWGITGSKK